jgi:hypothetical protein
LEDVKLIIDEVTGYPDRSSKTPLKALFFDLGDYEQADPPGFPATAWRVTTPDTQAKRDGQTGELVAATQHQVIFRESQLRKAVENHLKPWLSESSCFISVFSDYERHKTGRVPVDRTRRCTSPRST